MILSFFKRAVIVFCGVGISLLLSAVLAPPFLDLVERTINDPLPYEGALRFYIAFAWLLFMFAWLWRIFRNGDYRAWAVFGIVVVAYIATLVVFAGDRNHRLMEEFSWIRYTTTLFLFLAALCAFFAGIQQLQNRNKRLSLLWFLFSGGLLYGGLDEVLEIHEKIGKAIETATGFPHEVTDYVTVAYAGIVIIVSLVCARAFLSAYRKNQYALHAFGIGAIFYFLSTMFDTFDVIAIKKLTSLAKVLATEPSFVFSDAWYMLWSPKNFFNGLEEVFEQTAAMLFFAALFLLVIERSFLSFQQGVISEKRKTASIALAATLGIFLFANAAIAWDSVFSPSVVRDRNVAVIAGPSDGLFHSDDLEYNKNWGVIVANEGKGNVYQWKDGRWLKIPDPNHLLKDIDSIALTDSTLFASDGSQGKIFSYKKNGGWIEVASKKDGLKHPEDFIANEQFSNIYTYGGGTYSIGRGAYTILDESEKGVFIVHKELVQRIKDGRFVPVQNQETKMQTEIIKPTNPDWIAPEGIAQSGENFIITDDISGAVFKLSMNDKTARRIAKLNKPEDVAILSDKSSVISDNGWGAVFRVRQDGTVQKIAQFARPYRDLQGIAVDEQGRLYVITANGFDNTSFMPSFLFRIDNAL